MRLEALLLLLKSETLTDIDKGLLTKLLHTLYVESCDLDAKPASLIKTSQLWNEVTI